MQPPYKKHVETLLHQLLSIMELILIGKSLVKIRSVGQRSLTVSGGGGHGTSLGSSSSGGGSGGNLAASLTALLQLVFLLSGHFKVLGELLPRQNGDYTENLLGDLLGSAVQILVQNKVQRSGGGLEQLGQELVAVLFSLLGQRSLLILNLELLVGGDGVVSLGESVGDRLPQSSGLGGGLLGDRSHLGRVQGGLGHVEKHGLLASLEVLELNDLVPLSVNVVQRLAGGDLLDLALKGVVCTGDEALGLEVQVQGQVQSRTLDDRVVAVLVLESAKENTSSVGVGRGDLVLLGSALGVHNVQKLKNGGSLHQRGGGVTQETRLGGQSTVDTDVVLGDHVKVGGLGRVMRGLLGDVVSMGAVVKVPVACEELAENGIQRLLDGLGGDVPAGVVPLDHLDEPLDRVLGGMCLNDICGVLQRVCDSLEHGLSFENEGGQRDSREIGTGSQLRNDSHDDVLAISVELVHVLHVLGRVQRSAWRHGSGAGGGLCLGRSALLSACGLVRAVLTFNMSFGHKGSFFRAKPLCSTRVYPRGPDDPIDPLNGSIWANSTGQSIVQPVTQFLCHLYSPEKSALGLRWWCMFVAKSCV